MENLFDKHFTLDQANELIPHIRRLFAEVKTLLSGPAALLPGFSNGHHHGSPNGNGNGNGNGKAPGSGNGHGASPELAGGEASASQAEYADWSEEKRHEAAYRLLNALQSQGIVVQDVERGLIDFPSIRDEREVFLCYELSDGLSIQYFHECDAGYAGRKNLSESDE